MDEMKIQSKLLTGVVSKAVDKTVEQKTGYLIDTQIDHVNAQFEEDGVYIHVSAGIHLSKEEAITLFKALGLM